MFTYSRVVTSKFDKDSFIAVIPETFGLASSIGAIELFHPYGFAARPVDMDSSGACGMMTDVEGATGYSFLLNDGRVQSLLPEIKAGESFQYGPTGQFIRCAADGSVTIFTTDNATVNGRSVYLKIMPTGLMFNFPFGQLTFDDTGFHVKHNSGGRIDLGALQAPAPLDILGPMSYATMAATIIHVNGSAIHVGPDGGPVAPPQPVALANQVLALCAALNSVLTAIGAPGGLVSTSGAVTVGPEVGAAIVAANSALTAAVSGATPLSGPVASLSSTATGSV